MEKKALLFNSPFVCLTPGPVVFLTVVLSYMEFLSPHTHQFVLGGHSLGGVTVNLHNSQQDSAHRSQGAAQEILLPETRVKSKMIPLSLVLRQRLTSSSNAEYLYF